ncbi:SRPBCC family protein [Nocardia crassostreae]|uniref:SRPBCC family protein n=1 Tax=Nocardia crassostreae TaxID=53428 RepID=UPI000833CE87|nr:SRPBCC family protein [Nocardia crassostreae]
MAIARITEIIAAPSEVVFDVLTDHRGYADITPLRAVDLECEGQPAPNGVGAVRVVYTLGRRFPAVREQVTEYRAPSRFAYRIVSGLPGDIHGEVELSAAPGGTRMDYRHEVVPPFPLPETLVRAGSRFVIGFLVRGVAREARRWHGRARTDA